MKRVTIKDVAKEAGVSITTVSHSLSGGGVVKKETRERILRIAQEMNYIPDWSGNRDAYCTKKSARWYLHLTDSS